jgi:diacylglycerol O-acyltransferase / wax synthase
MLRCHAVRAESRIACRRVLSQEEWYELIGYMKDALKEIEAMPSVEQAAAAKAATAPAEPRRIADAAANGPAVEATRKAPSRKTVRATKTATVPRRAATRARAPRKETAQ